MGVTTQGSALRRILAGAACAGSVLALLAPPAAAAPTPSADCVTSGQSNTITFPTGVLSTWIDMQGAPGGNSGSAAGGAGGQITGLLTVPAGRSITITAGGPGQAGGTGGAGGGGNGAGGGAGGGGMSTIAYGAVPPTPASLIAAGGGGAGSITGATGGAAPGGTGQPSGGGAGAGQGGSNGGTATAGGGGGAGLNGGNAGTSNAGGGAGSALATASGFTTRTNAAGTDPGGYVCVSTIAITTSSLDTLTVGDPTSTALAATYPLLPSATLEWSVVSGSLPAGLMLSVNGTVSGTPTAVASGAYSVTIRATDADPLRGTATEKVFTGTVNATSPTVTINTAADVTASFATGRATVASNGASTSGVQCRIATSAGGVSAATPIAATPGTVAATATTAVACGFTGLSASTTYWYDVSATNTHGTTTSSVQSFTTAASSGGGSAPVESGPAPTPAPSPVAAPPVATTLPASSIFRAQAIGNGRVLASTTGTTSITCVVRPAGSAAPPVTVPAVPSALPPSAPITAITCPFTALPAATAYEFAVVATAPSGISPGQWVAFRTTGRRGPRVDPPNRLRPNAWTTLLDGPTFSDFGAPVKVRVTGKHGHLPGSVTVRRDADSSVRIWVGATHPRLTVTWSADAPPGGRAWAVDKTYPRPRGLR